MRGGIPAALDSIMQPTALGAWIASDFVTVMLIKLRVEDTLAEVLADSEAQHPPSTSNPRSKTP